MTLINESKKQKIGTFYIPLILSILLFFNGIIALIIAILPYLKSAISHTDLSIYAEQMLHNRIINHLGDHSSPLINGVTLKVNTALFFIFGYILLLIGRGVYKRLRFFWLCALIALVILFCNSFFLYTRTIFFTWFYAFEIAVFLISWKIFNRRLSGIRFSYAQFVVVLSFILALLYGVIGSYLLRDEFQGLKTWTDAVYFTIVTYSTVGYGDITPVTESARLFVSSMIFIGLGAFAGILTFIVSALVQRIQNILNVFHKGKKHMNNHIIICGYNDLSELLIQDLQKAGLPFLIIDDLDQDDPKQADLKNLMLSGQASDPALLEKAHIFAAKSIIIAYNRDADNILTLMTVQDVLGEKNRVKLTTVIRINNENNIEKAKKLGADEIISPLVMAASAMLKKAAIKP